MGSVMAVQLHPREYLTFDELEMRWGCGTNDLKSLIVHGHLVPSFIINHIARKVRFSRSADQNGEFWTPVVIETVADGDWDEPPHHLHQTQGMYYLLHPEVESALQCRFFYFSTNRDHQKGVDDENICFMFSLNRKHPLNHGISLDLVCERGMVALPEIQRYEAARSATGNDETHNGVLGSALEAERPLNPRAETTYLNIIAAMLELIQTPRDDRTSEAAVIAELVENYSDKPGISKSTLEQKFAEAKRRIKTT